MLTKMCARFRETAAKLREDYTFVGFGGMVNRDPTIFQAATELDEAAFAVEGLRVRCDELWELALSLRKLIEDAQGFYESGKDCTTCPLFDQCGESFETRGCSGYAIIHERMEELGIGVRQCQ